MTANVAVETSLNQLVSFVGSEGGSVAGTSDQNGKEGFELFVSLLADFGGLFVFLYLLFFAILAIATYGEFENYIVSEIFKEPKTNPEENDEGPSKTERADQDDIE